MSSGGLLNQYLENINLENDAQHFENSWEVEKILATIQMPDTRYYKVKFVRYIWIAEEETLQSFQQLLDLYLQQNQTDSSSVKENIIQVQCNTSPDQQPSAPNAEIKTLENHQQGSSVTQIANSLSSSHPSIVTSTSSTTANVRAACGISSSIQSSPFPSSTTVNNAKNNVLQSRTPLSGPTTDTALTIQTKSTINGPSVSSLLTAHEVFSQQQSQHLSSFQQNATPFNRSQCLAEGLSPVPNPCLDNTVSNINRGFSNPSSSIVRCVDSPTSTVNQCLDNPAEIAEEQSHSLDRIVESSLGQSSQSLENNFMGRAIETSGSSDKSDQSIPYHEPSPVQYIADVNSFATTSFTMANTGEEKRFKCSVCGKSFGRKTSLQRHAVIHTGEKPFQCQHCDKSFNQNSILQRHMLIHKDTKLFQCEFCNKTFIEKSALRRHCVTHSNAPPSLRCDTCGKEFRLKEYLAKHEFLHKGIKPYICKTCGRPFADPSAFKRHAITHVTRSESLECSSCLKRLKNPRSLKKHLSTCKSLTCVICRTALNSKEELERHRTLVHGRTFKCNLCTFQADDYIELSLHTSTHA